MNLIELELGQFRLGGMAAVLDSIGREFHARLAKSLLPGLKMNLSWSVPLVPRYTDGSGELESWRGSA